MYLKSCVPLQVLPSSGSCTKSAATTANTKSSFARLKVPRSRRFPGASTAPWYAHSRSQSSHREILSQINVNIFWRSYASVLNKCTCIYSLWLCTPSLPAHKHILDCFNTRTIVVYYKSRCLDECLEIADIYTRCCESLFWILFAPLDAKCQYVNTVS